MHDFLIPPPHQSLVRFDGGITKLKWQKSWAEPKKVGDGWGEFTHLFSPGRGRIYAVMPNGDLMYFQHIGWRNGTYLWNEDVKAKIATGWNGYDFVFARNTTSDRGFVGPK